MTTANTHGEGNVAADERYREGLQRYLNENDPVGQSLSGAFKSRLQRLKTERDEIKLQMHLAGKDMRAAWERVTDKWQTADQQIQSMARAGEKSGEEIEAAVDLLLKEIETGLKRIRNAA